MTTPELCGSPIDTDGPRIPIYTPEFCADPHRVYAAMRGRYGAYVPVELAPGVPATLVIRYREAVSILHDAEHFPADPRHWEKNVPVGCPVLPMMEWFPAARFCTGTEHARYRAASVAPIREVDLYALHLTVEQVAVAMIGTFAANGAADLLSQYAFPLVFEVLNKVVGCPEDVGQRIAAGMAARFNTVGADQGMDMLMAALTELITLKRAKPKPGDPEPEDDITRRLMRHPANLNDDELCAQLMSLYGAGIEAMRNLIGNTVLLLLTDGRFGGDLTSGTLSTRDALDEVLFDDPPMANFSFRYPRQPMLLGDVWLPAHQPVVISLAACNNDPTIRGADCIGNRSHLAYSAGEHACPADTLAYQIVQDAIDQLLDHLPDIRLAVKKDTLEWRPGPFQRALIALPVVW